MAKIRKCKLSWQPSDSSKIAGYRLYWSKGERVDYDCPFVDLGNVCEAFLPDALNYRPKHNETLVLGVTAVDKNGNESDITTLPRPYELTVPLAPGAFSITALETFNVMEEANVPADEFDAAFEQELQQQGQGFDPQHDDNGSPDLSEEGNVKFYQDVGYRKLTTG